MREKRGRVFIDCVRGSDSQYSRRTSNGLKHCGDRKGLRMSVHLISRNHEAVTGKLITLRIKSIIIMTVHIHLTPFIVNVVN